MHNLRTGFGKLLSGAISFLKSDWKFVLPLAVGMSVLVAALLLLLPRQYSKEVTLSVSPVLSDIQKSFGKTEPDNPALVNQQATRFLQEGEIARQAEINVAYDERSREFRLTIYSRNKELLEKIPRRAVDTVETGFQRQYEESLGAALRAGLENIEIGLQDARRALDRVEQEIEQVPATGAGSEVLPQLEARRASAVESLTIAEDLKKEREQQLRNLPRLAAEPISVQVLDDSGGQQRGSLPQAIVAATLLGFVVAVAASCFRRTNMRSSKTGLSEL